MKKETKILIVDDNVEFCANLKDILELKGYQVESIHDGFSALEAVKDAEFDLVLMDIKMPLMDGVETFKKLKQISPQTPVIMMTAFAVEDLILDALNEGAFGVFHKPLDFEKLFQSIERSRPDGTLIMVVDDNRDQCANLNDVLSQKGYRVKTAYDGNTAVEMSRKNKFDIILLDMKLPTINGLETYLAIRKIRPDVVAIIITGHFDAMADLVQQALKEKAYVCLEKPLDMDSLLELLGSLI